VVTQQGIIFDDQNAHRISSVYKWH